MVDSKELSERLKEDRLSQLPDLLITHVLSHLSTKEAVQTSVLSNRWRHLWLWVPYLATRYFDFPDHNAFVSFGDRFFDSQRVSSIETVHLYICEKYDWTGSGHATSYLKSWIDAAFKRKVQDLCVENSISTSYGGPLRYEVPLRLCETLVSLTLSSVEVTLDHTEVFSLPRLKTLELNDNRYRYEDTFERLVSCCPVLEKLYMFEYTLFTPTKVYRVLSMSLKKLNITIKALGYGFVIDAPRLISLKIDDNFSDSFMIKNIDSSAKVDISLTFGLFDYDEASVSSRRASIRSFLTGISKVRDMTLCRHTLKLICRYLKSEPLPKFGYMSRLRVTLRVSDLNCLPTFLESCANLKSLILVWNGNSQRMSDDSCYESPIKFSSVPKCLLLSLEFVDIKTSLSGYASEMKVVSYFLENSAILKKLTLRLNHYSMVEKSFVRIVREIPRRSATCKVVLL